MKIILKPLGALALCLCVMALIGVVVMDKIAASKKETTAPDTFARNAVATPAPPKPASAPTDSPLPTADQAPGQWAYTTETPADSWMKPDYDTKKSHETWQTGASGFGNDQTATINTPWRTADIWMRREFTLPADWHGPHSLRVFHDEDAEVYINGVLAAKIPEYSPSYASVTMTEAGYAALKPGKKNLIAVHCHNAVGGQYIDAGL